MLPRCYLMANGAERPGHRGLLSWVLGFHYLGTWDITWLLKKVPPHHHTGVGEGVFSRGEVVLLKVRPLSPGQVGYLQPAGLGTKPTTAPRLFTRPCTSGHTPLASHMEMRYLCSYVAASKSWPTGCPSGCVPWSEFLEPRFYLRRFFYYLRGLFSSGCFSSALSPVPKDSAANRLHYCPG